MKLMKKYVVESAIKFPKNRFMAYGLQQDNPPAWKLNYFIFEYI